MTDQTPDQTISYSLADWRAAYDRCADAGWETEDITAPDSRVVALTDAYQKHKNDEDIVLASLTAAAAQFPEWTVHTYRAVASSFSIRVDGWAELATDWLDDHHPDFPTIWLDLDRVGHDVQRDNEVYVQLEGPGLFIFTKLDTAPE